MSPNSYNLLWEAYATTQGNPGPNVIEDILNHLGIDKCSTQLNSALSGHYSTDKLALQSYIDIRNECAHTGSAINVPSTSDIREFCSSIYRIASAVVSVLEVRLGQSPFGTNLNTANFSELENIPGLGPVRIMALINFRNANGRFNRLQDISQVPGFGQKLIKSLRMYIYTS
jgi:competence ComEA-like helix-hairpin-helix protein